MRFQESILLPPPLSENISYLLFLDGDDFLDVCAIEVYVREIGRNDLEIVGSGFTRLNLVSEVLGWDYSALGAIPKNEVLAGEQILAMIPYPYFHAVVNLLIDFRFFKENYFSFVPNIIYEDHHFGISLFLKAKRVMILEHYFYFQVNSLDSTTRPRVITQERKVLDFESWAKTIEELEKLKSHQKLIRRYIRHFYLPVAYRCLLEIENPLIHQRCKERLKGFRYRTLKIVLLKYFPSVFNILKRMKDLLSKRG